jgi:hypothetical protein
MPEDISGVNGLTTPSAVVGGFMGKLHGLGRTAKYIHGESMPRMPAPMHPIMILDVHCANIYITFIPAYYKTGAKVQAKLLSIARCS